MNNGMNVSVLVVKQLMRLMNHKGLLSDDEYQLIMDSPVVEIEKIMDKIIGK